MRKARAKVRKIVSLVSLVRLKNRAWDHFDIMARSVSCGLDFAVGYGKALSCLGVALEVRKISRAALCLAHR
jgi:hypothetical protein